VGRRACFEVTVNGNLVHSKLATKAFPDFKATAMMVGRVVGGAEPEKIVVLQQSCTCSVL
jgi:hypothetical protein